jgi:hypothetical protein
MHCPYLVGSQIRSNRPRAEPEKPWECPPAKYRGDLPAEAAGAPAPQTVLCKPNMHVWPPRNARIWRTHVHSTVPSLSLDRYGCGYGQRRPRLDCLPGRPRYLVVRRANCWARCSHGWQHQGHEFNQAVGPPRARRLPPTNPDDPPRNAFRDVDDFLTAVAHHTGSWNAIARPARWTLVCCGASELARHTFTTMAPATTYRSYSIP